MKLGKKVRIHPLVLPTVFFFLWVGSIQIFFDLLLFVTIHELSHCIVARCFGAKIKEILVTPVGERAELRNVERLSYWKRQGIWFSGPLMSMVLGYFFWKVTKQISYAEMNFIIGGFNLLPFLPMDGGSMVLNALGKQCGTLKTLGVLRKISIGFGYFLCLAGCIQVLLYPFNISLLVIGCYFISVNKKGYLPFTYYTYQELLHPKKKFLPIREMMVQTNLELGELASRMNTDYYFIFCMEQNGMMQKWSQKEIMRALLEKGTASTIWD